MRDAASRSDRGLSQRWLTFLLLVAYVVCVGGKLATSQFDISRFIVAGDEVVSPDRLKHPIAVEAHSPGYDGQFFYRLALNPFDPNPDAYGVSMRSHPEVRAQRIVYPTAAWALSFARGALVPYSLVAVNLLAMVALGIVAMRLAVHFDLPAVFGLLVPFYPGFVLTMCRDTAEIIATAVALSGLLAAVKGKWPMAALIASVAVLTREATLLYLAGYGLVATLQTIKSRSLDYRVLWCACPLAVYLLWQAIIKALWGAYSYEVVGHDDFSAIPLLSYFKATISYFGALTSEPFRYSVIYSVLMCLAFTAYLAFGLYHICKRRLISLPILIPAALYTFMAITFSEAVWRDPWGYVRVLNDFYVLVLVVLIASRNLPALRNIVPFVAVTWVASLAYTL